MKIERITACNIASLAGTHSVDFTKAPLRTAGLYSISGATGAGKTTLLDALCLALFDQTPRLNQVGRLAELTDGEKQNDTRTLLRRNTAFGFAEVAFVGVDQQTYTARWSVRRSHNKPSGKLQHVEMALYRGHLAPGGDGHLLDGGKRTLVKDAIVEKIGLTFEQFTRAVLLAQNDFATFLKADDKQRAEILQALTGTEHFEAISRAVFARYSDEKKAIETIEAQLGGFAPMSAETRAEAIAAEALASGKLREIEADLKQHETRIDWFRHYSTLQTAVDNSKLQLTESVQARDVAVERRMELQRTESVTRAARTLRDAEIRANKDLVSDQTALEAAAKSLVTLTDSLKQATEELDKANAARRQMQQKQEAAEPLLKHARELDAKLEPLQSRVRKASEAVANTKRAAQEAAKKYNDAVARVKTFGEEQQNLQDRLDKNAAFAPFVKESATWQHRIEAAINAESEVVALRKDLASFEGQIQKERSELEARRIELSDVQQKTDLAARELAAAEAAEREFDPEHLAQQRTNFDTAHRVLTTLQQELNAQQELKDEANAAAKEMSELETTQAQELGALKQIQKVDLPEAARDVQVAQNQLDAMKAAIDDHAKRLRTMLQPENPCPVCGSESHPYRDHAPDFEATAINAAKEYFNKLAALHEQLTAHEQYLSVSTESRSEQLSKLQKHYKSLIRTLKKATYSSSEQSDVSAVLALADVHRSAAVAKRLESVENSLAHVAKFEKALRDATKLTQKNRKLAEEIFKQQQTLQQFVNDREKQHSVTSTKHAAAVVAVQKSSDDVRDAMMTLAGLFSALPHSKDEFAADAVVFRDSFASSTKTYAEVQDQLHDLSGKLQEVAATLSPLDDARQNTANTLSDSEVEHAAAAIDHDTHIQQRRQLFDGRAADIVESEIEETLNSTEVLVNSLTAAKHETEKSLAAAESTQKNISENVQHSIASVKSAQTAMNAWLASFNAASDRELTLNDVDRMLTRDAAWFESERVYFKQIDESVTAAESACAVHEQQLQQHLNQRPTTDEETVVLEAIRRIRDDLAQAEKSHEAALEIINNDDRLRQRGQTLAERLVEQQHIAEPWLRLNELIGSKEGDKFRMIAQRRTLDVLLGYANHQLTQLSARYRLERLSESLNLIVVDCEMGEERRSIHSLSGGESFLVSLALALGLASLTSNRMRIESLFIDEGFGSLDPQTLTTAMNALTHLEAQGRKVGVISHVTEMTDAIPVQIRIEKRRSGGASRIVIPGADPDQVNPQTDLELAANTLLIKPSAVQPNNSDAVQAVAQTILAILQRESLQGKQKVSTTALRKEIGCDAKMFGAAQVSLAEKIVMDGRSLMLLEM